MRTHSSLPNIVERLADFARLSNGVKNMAAKRPLQEIISLELAVSELLGHRV